jgi:hypothetical protein
LDEDANVIHRLVGGGTEAGTFPILVGHPTVIHMAVDENHVYFSGVHTAESTSGQRDLYKVRHNGTLVWRVPISGTGNLTSIAVDPYGFVYHQRRVWQADGTLVSSTADINRSALSTYPFGRYEVYPDLWEPLFPIIPMLVVSTLGDLALASTGTVSPALSLMQDGASSLDGDGSLQVTLTPVQNLASVLSGQGGMGLELEKFKPLAATLLGSSSVTVDMEVEEGGSAIPMDGLQQWLAADSDYMTSTYSNGNNVTAWDDLSPNEYDITSVTMEATSESAPTLTYRTGGQGGKPYLRVDYAALPSWSSGTRHSRVNLVSSRPALSVGASNDVTIFFVGRLHHIQSFTQFGTIEVDAFGDQNAYWDGSTNREKVRLYHYRSRALGGAYSYWSEARGNSSLRVSHESPGTTYFLSNADRIHMAGRIAGDMKWRRNGTAVTPSFTYSGAGVLPPNLQFTRYAFNNTGGSAVSWANNVAGETRIYEIIIYDRALSTSEVEQVEAYLADKYGL